ncbi:MAG: hypothetical protein J7M10_03245 [Candidatus Cloacimonetes bacterium]|nr:hypothetical protein [Candidatus Cloacimonadota bacterium]
MADVFFDILPVFYFLIFCIIFVLGLWAYKETQNKSPLLIGIAFALFAVIFILNEIIFSTFIIGITILMRIVAYLLILYAVFNLGISYSKKKNDKKTVTKEDK